MSRNLFAQLGAAAVIGSFAAASHIVIAQQRQPGSQGPGRAGAAADVPACGGRSDRPQVPCADDVAKMREVLPARAPAAPRQPRRVLVYGRAMGYQHSSIPLAARMVEELGSKTGAWTIYYSNPAMLEHILAGVQYALGDLVADDSPSVKLSKKTIHRTRH